jgi:hypothetical protein
MFLAQICGGFREETRFLIPQKKCDKPKGIASLTAHPTFNNQPRNRVSATNFAVEARVNQETRFLTPGDRSCKYSDETNYQPIKEKYCYIV